MILMKIVKKSLIPKGLSVALIPDQELGGFTAHVPNIPAFGEGVTEEEAIADLKEARIGYIETFGLQDTVSRIAQSPKVCFVQWDLDELAHV